MTTLTNTIAPTVTQTINNIMLSTNPISVTDVYYVCAALADECDNIDCYMTANTTTMEFGDDSTGEHIGTFNFMASDTPQEVFNKGVRFLEYGLN